MKSSKKRIAIMLCIVISVTLTLSGCSADAIESLLPRSGTDEAAVTAESAQAIEAAEEAAETAEEIIQEDSAAAEYDGVISLNGSNAEITGSGAAAEGTDILISGAGTYKITGTLDNGRIVVDAQGEDVVLLLSGASISCSYSCPLFIYKSASTTVVLDENTVNTLTDSQSYDYSDSYSSREDSEPNACLYSKSDLMITGSGELNVKAAFNNGITGKDTLQLVYAGVAVEAENNGITGKDCVIISAASVSVECGGNGIASSNDSDETLGYITLLNSAVTVNCEEDGIDAQTALTVTDSTLNITSSGASESSAKGLKACSIMLNSGSFTINSTDDAIHAQGDVSIFGGDFTLTSGDDGIHGDDSVSISGGSINVAKSYEGIEGNIINITGGEISVIASDDGMNAAGGTDQSGFGTRGDSFSSTSAAINISGGVTSINAEGDGVDSNGSINVTGGELYVSGPTNSGNGALDYGTSAVISGGIVVAAGSSGMAENFGTASTQGSILVNLSGNAGDTISLADSSGAALASYTAEKRFECVVISCPQLTVGQTYTISAAENTSTVTLTSLIYGSSGMGGMMPVGGNQPGGGMGPGSGEQPNGGMGPGGGEQPNGGMGPGGGNQPSGGMGPGNGNGPGGNQA